MPSIWGKRPEMKRIYSWKAKVAQSGKKIDREMNFLELHTACTV
tara:strand:- start:360 stop:491 length:132 start_codon:yes stop_codon:yes gene_type:complete